MLCTMHWSEVYTIYLLGILIISALVVLRMSQWQIICIIKAVVL